MFEKFSEEAIKVIMHAQEEARRLNHEYVGCEHLLLGLFAIGEGEAYKNLKDRMSFADLRISVEQKIPKGKEKSSKDLPFDTAAKISLQRAFRECLHAKQGTIASEHILLGLLVLPGESEAVVSTILDDFEIDRHDLRQQLWSEILSKTENFGRQDALLLMSQCPDILTFAIAEAYKVQVTEIGSDVIFLALLRMNEDVTKLLQDFNVTYDDARSAIDQCSNLSPMLAVGIQFTDSAKCVMQKAQDEVALLGHATLNVKHILLALTRIQDGIHYQIFREKNVDIGALRASVLALFEETR